MSVKRADRPEYYVANGLCQVNISVPQFDTLELPLPLQEVFANLLEMPYPAYLDGGLGSEGPGRFSYATADPFLILRSKGRQVEIETGGSVSRLDADPFVVLQGLLKRYSLSPAQGLPHFQGGALGYLGYELGRHLERLPTHAVDDLSLPEMNIGFYDWVIAQDHARDLTWAIATGLPEGSSRKAQERLQWIREMLREVRGASPNGVTPHASRLTSNMTQGYYTDAVRAVKDYIAAGDVYQVNVSLRYEASLPGDPWNLYRRLRAINPAPFCAFLQYPELAVLSASPEAFLHLKDGIVTSRPMKGTRPRGVGTAEDNRLADELLASEKDRAENVMIVDLVRSDLGKVCIPGSIQVPELFAIEKFPTVLQMVSTVCGRKRAEVDATELLRACFPGGSVTGAPKIRAMEIIDELEPTQRGVYCGAVGYIGFDGSMQMSMPIRIIIAKGGQVYVPVGAGIVADSDPEGEYEETRQKARASFAALSVEH